MADGSLKPIGENIVSGRGENLSDFPRFQFDGIKLVGVFPQRSGAGRKDDPQAVGGKAGIVVIEIGASRRQIGFTAAIGVHDEDVADMVVPMGHIGDFPVIR